MFTKAKLTPAEIIVQTGAPDDAYRALKAHFSEEEMTRSTAAIGTLAQAA